MVLQTFLFDRPCLDPRFVQVGHNHLERPELGAGAVSLEQVDEGGLDKSSELVQLGATQNSIFHRNTLTVLAGVRVHDLLLLVHNDQGGPPGPAHHVDTVAGDATGCVNNKTDHLL